MSMRTAVSDPVAARRSELADFLRARRADLHPEDLGLDLLLVSLSEQPGHDALATGRPVELDR